MKRQTLLIWSSALVLLAGCSTPPGSTGAPPELTTVTVTCAPSSVVRNGSVRCTASATDQHGEPFSVPGYTWTSSDESVAKVDAEGVASALWAGTVTLTASATANGVTKQGQASLTVTEHAPTVHSKNITTNETWRASDNPHVVHGLLDVDGASTSATLTLEPGVEVRFDADSQLYFKNGALQAPGTEAQPIRLVANQPAPTRGFWRGLLFATSAGASLMEHVTLSDCGSVDPELGVGTCLSLLTNTTVVERDLTVRNSGGMGVWLVGPSEFAAGSARLSVSGCASYPMRVHADQVGALPTGGTFTGNDRDSIVVSDDVRHSQTWPNLGIPYDCFGPGLGVGVNSYGSTPPTPITLTLTAGTVLRFGSSDSFLVGSQFSTAPADLIVNGTEEAPVRFTSSMRTPRPGDWGGVNLYQFTSNTRISHAIIEYAGGTSFERGLANLKVNASASCTDCPTLDHVTLRKSSAYGLSLNGPIAAGSTALEIRDNAGAAIFMPADSVGSFPAGLAMSLSGNSPDAVEVNGEVSHSQTWPNLGIPYNIPRGVSVTGSWSPTTLTLSAGSVLRFGSQAYFNVGSSFSGDQSTLVVNGTEQAPVRFTSSSATPRPGDWSGVSLYGLAVSHRLSHALIEYGGGNEPGTKTGNLNVYGSYSCSYCPTTGLDHVVLQKGSAYGLMLLDGQLTSDSTGLTVRDNASHAIRATANSVGSLPAGTTVSGNSLDAVEVSSSDIRTTQTWPALGIPYLMTQGLYVDNSSRRPTLTLTAGTELRFDPGTGVIVADFSQGALVAAGTEQAPVRFVPNSSTPSKGFWAGIHFRYGSTGSRLDHAFISHGGGTSGYSMQGDLNVYWENGAFVTNSTISDSATCGITVNGNPDSDSGRVTTDFTLPSYGNTFLNNANGAQCAK